MPKFRRQVFTIEILSVQDDDTDPVDADAVIDLLDRDFMFTDGLGVTRVLSDEVTDITQEEMQDLFDQRGFEYDLDVF